MALPFLLCSLPSFRLFGECDPSACTGTSVPRARIWGCVGRDGCIGLEAPTPGPSRYEAVNAAEPAYEHGPLKTLTKAKFYSRLLITVEYFEEV